MRWFTNLIERDPARVFMAVRMVLLLIAGLGLSWFTPALAEVVLVVVALLLGVDVAATEATRAKVASPQTLQLAGMAVADSSPVAGFVRSLVARLVPPASLTLALALVEPVIEQFKTVALSEPVRANVTRMVHSRLRAAGLLRGRDIPDA